MIPIHHFFHLMSVILRISEELSVQSENFSILSVGDMHKLTHD